MHFHSFIDKHTVSLTNSYHQLLIFCCENLILHQKKNWERYLDEDQQKSAKNCILTESCSDYSELAQQNSDVTCSKLSRYEENIGDKKLSLEHTPRLFLLPFSKTSRGNNRTNKQLFEGVIDMSVVVFNFPLVFSKRQRRTKNRVKVCHEAFSGK